MRDIRSSVDAATRTPAPAHLTKNRPHLDVTAGELDAEVDRLVAVGASLVTRRGDERFRWVTLADPQGNEFDVAQESEATTAYRARPGAAVPCRP